MQWCDLIPSGTSSPETALFSTLLGPSTQTSAQQFLTTKRGARGGFRAFIKGWSDLAADRLLAAISALRG